MIWHIYLVTNTVNGKVYVGLTRKTIEKRWIDHLSTAKTRQKSGALQNAILKYGRHAFTIEALCACRTVEDAEAMEIQLIAEHNSLAPHGYNLAAGGCVSGSHHPDTIAKMRENMAKRLEDPAYRQRLKDGRKAAWADPEHRAVMMAATKKKLANPEQFKMLQETASANSKKNWADPEKAAAMRAKFKTAWVIRKQRDFPHLVTA